MWNNKIKSNYDVLKTTFINWLLFVIEWREKEKEKAELVSKVARKLMIEEKITDKKLRDFKDEIAQVLEKNEGLPPRPWGCKGRMTRKQEADLKQKLADEINANKRQTRASKKK